MIAPWPPTKLPHYLTTTEELRGTCVWLSMALLLHYAGYDTVAETMSNILAQRQGFCSWLQPQGLDIVYCGKNELVRTWRHDRQLKYCISVGETESLAVLKMSGIHLFKTLIPGHEHLIWRRVRLSECSPDIMRWEPEHYLEYLERNSGYYILFLSSAQNESFHAIAVNSTKNPGEVYDPEEEYVLKLNRDVLDICCGEEETFTKFSSLYKLTIDYTGA